jgi:hypothetical protein
MILVLIVLMILVLIVLMILVLIRTIPTPAATAG